MLHFSQATAVGGLSAWQTGHCMSGGGDLHDLSYVTLIALIMTLIALKSSGVSAQLPTKQCPERLEASLPTHALQGDGCFRNSPGFQCPCSRQREGEKSTARRNSHVLFSIDCKRHW